MLQLKVLRGDMSSQESPSAKPNIDPDMLARADEYDAVLSQALEEAGVTVVPVERSVPEESDDPELTC